MAVEGTLEITISNQVVVPVYKNIAPIGWHVPSSNEMVGLRNSLDPVHLDENTNTAGGQMKMAGTEFWLTPNTGATNSSGFNGKGSSNRNESGVFDDLFKNSAFWNTRDDSADYGGSGALLYNGANFYQAINSVTKKKNGLSLRCVKDSTTLSIGQTSTVMGISGTIYPTKCMPDGKEWMTANLKETQFNDGTLVPIVEDNTAWGTGNTAKMCWHNNTPN